MSGLRPNSITLYLRPIAYQQRYQIRNAAAWLVQKKFFVSFNKALKYMLFLEEYKPSTYANIMSAYYDAVDYKVSYKRTYNINDYRSSDSNLYGQEPHMWY